MTENEAFLSIRYTPNRQTMLEQIMDHLMIPHDSWGAKSQAFDYALRTATHTSNPPQLIEVFFTYGYILEFIPGDEHHVFDVKASAANFQQLVRSSVEEEYPDAEVRVILNRAYESELEVRVNTRFTHSEIPDILELIDDVLLHYEWEATGERDDA